MLRLIGCCLAFLTGNLLLASPSQDSALWAVQAIAQAWQQTAQARLLRWEAMNHRLVELSRQSLPGTRQPVSESFEGVWIRHQGALPPAHCDSFRQDLGRLDMLHQRWSRLDQTLAGHLSQPEMTAPDRERVLARLQELAVAMEDANIVQDRLRYQLQTQLSRTIPLASSSPAGMARAFFRDGTTMIGELLLAVKSGRRNDALSRAGELEAWLRAAPQRRARWRQAGGTGAQEAVWIRWERLCQTFVESVSASLGNGFPPETLPHQLRWSRTYLWYNHVLLPQVSGEISTLNGLLGELNQAFRTIVWLDLGWYPSFRPVAVPPPAPADAPLPDHWIFVVDVSGSMQQADRLPLFRRWLPGWAARLPATNRISMISFSDSVQWLLEGVSAGQLQDVLAQSHQLAGKGKTNVLPALEAAVERAKAQDHPCRLVLVSDGGLDYGPGLAALVERASLEGIRVDVVYLPGKDNRFAAALEQLARLGGGKVERIE